MTLNRALNHHDYKSVKYAMMTSSVKNAKNRKCLDSN
jgi:hypothetical protein